MKWHKFKRLVAKHQWLIQIVDPFGYARHDPKTMSVDDRLSKIRDLVRHRLEYVAFRPFDLDPYATRGQYETSQTLEYAVRCDPYYGGSRGAVYTVEWEIVWHVGNQPASPSPHDEGYTLSDSITRIQMEHAEGRFGEGDLVFDFIVKRISEADGPGQRGTMSIEVYEFTPPLRVDKLNLNDWPHERDLISTRAYMRNEPLSPIIPGSTMNS